MIDEMVLTDVLVIGGGGAGARAAIEAAKANVDVLITVKGLFGRSGCTVMAEGGYNASFGFADNDCMDYHFEDTVRGGRFINNQELVDILVKESPQSLLDLEWFGAAFDRVRTNILSQRSFGGHRYRRTCHKGDRTGHEMMNALKEECYRRDIQVMEEVSITSLLTHKGKVSGATALDLVNGRFIVIKAKSVILATGGGGRLYPVTTNPYQKTCDGFVQAYEAGAELIDMEMVQFHPTGMVTPPSAKGVLVTEAVRGEGGKIYNAKGERFMAKYDKERMELSTRDVVTRSIYSEIMDGNGTEHGGVYLDISHLPDEIIEQKLGMMLRQFIDVGVDIRQGPMEISPSAHHFMGGVRIDETCQTSLPNLYACGEVTGGIHGANRLGGNSLAETQVFGKIAGRSAGKKAKKSKLLPVDDNEVKTEYQRIFRFKREGISPYALRKRIQDLLWHDVGIIRTKGGLEKALTELDTFKDELENIGVGSDSHYSLQHIHAIEMDSFLTAAEMVIRAALARTESRGAHFREDYFQEDPKWLKNLIIKKSKNGMLIKKRPALITKLSPEAFK